MNDITSVRAFPMPTKIRGSNAHSTRHKNVTTYIKDHQRKYKPIFTGVYEETATIDRPHLDNLNEAQIKEFIISTKRRLSSLEAAFSPHEVEEYDDIETAAKAAVAAIVESDGETQMKPTQKNRSGQKKKVKKVN